MSDNKKYYYLKVKDSFFSSEEMKVLAAQKNGVEYQLLYLKLCLLSAKNNGRLEFREGIPYDADMLSSILDVQIDTVKTGCELLSRLGLLEMLETGVMYMTDIQSLLGHGSSEAERLKLYRKRIKDEKSIAPYVRTKSVQKRTPEIESEKESEIELKQECAKRVVFVRPSLNELQAYITEKGYTFTADAFIAHYESNGWLVGKNKMQSWKAACKTWQIRQGDYKGKPARVTHTEKVLAGGTSKAGHGEYILNGVVRKYADDEGVELKI